MVTQSSRSIPDYEEASDQPLGSSSRDSLLARIDVVIRKLVPANVTNGSTDPLETLADYSDEFKAGEAVVNGENVEGDGIGTPNSRTLYSSPSSSGQNLLSSAQRELLDGLARDYVEYLRETERACVTALAVWRERRRDSNESSEGDDSDSSGNDWDAQLDTRQQEVLDLDLKFQPLKALFPDFADTIEAYFNDFLAMVEEVELLKYTLMDKDVDAHVPSVSVTEPLKKFAPAPSSCHTPHLIINILVFPLGALVGALVVVVVNLVRPHCRTWQHSKNLSRNQFIQYKKGTDSSDESLESGATNISDNSRMPILQIQANESPAEHNGQPNSGHDSCSLTCIADPQR